MTLRPTKTPGGGTRRAAPSRRTMQERLDDPTEPLYTVAVAADLLGLDPQAFRRLSNAIDQAQARPSGNQRRYSRQDLTRLAAAVDLASDGHNHQSIATILELQSRIDLAEAER